MVVIFDPQDILTDTAGCRFVSWQRMAWEQGILYDEDLDDRLKGMDEETHLTEILSRGRRGYSAAERLALLTRHEDIYEECIRQMGDKVVIPGAARLLKKLRQRSVRLAAVMTDGTAGAVLTGTSLRPLFDCVSRQEEVGGQLTEVMQRMEARPEECLLVTANGPTAQLAFDKGIRAILCDCADGEKPILRRILSVLPQSAEQ